MNTILGLPPVTLARTTAEGDLCRQPPVACPSIEE